MNKLDDAISTIGYIIDTLIAYRNIIETGDCNECGLNRNCRYVPDPGEQVRYNCPFFVKEPMK